MGKVKRRSKAPSGCSSSSPENDKNELREALFALKGGAQENGVGFSGREGLGDGGVVEVVKSRVFENKGVSVQRDFVGKELEGLADSEMNGVSSLLKMRGSGKRLLFPCGGGGGSLGVGTEGGRKDGKRNSEDEDDGRMVTIDVPVVDVSEKNEVEVEDLANNGYGFSVGDFVWGKIKSHPWWPGRIYDPCDASDFALKLRQKNRLLVAYFGDGTFAWCHPCQLKPFEENFQDMARQSSSRAFANAVQEAVDEVGRLLESKASNSYPSEKTGSEYELLLAKNSGIKEGVIVPENGIERFLDVLTDPAELLSRVKQIAEIISIDSVLELEILKARLSAFYLSKGGYNLPYYEVPQPVPGLEDNSMVETVDVGNSKGAVEAPVQGPFEEDYSTVMLNPNFGELSHPHEISGNRSNHRVKQKSIAEIMGEEDKDISTKIKDGDATDKVTAKRKRRGSEEAKASKPLHKREGLLLSTDGIPASAENDGIEGKVKSKGTLSLLKEKKVAFSNKNASNGSKKRTGKKGNASEQSEKSSLSRERKKSRYLSPPFTTPGRGHMKGGMETVPLNASSEVRVLEPVAGVANQFLKSPEPLERKDEVLQENSKGLTTLQDCIDSSDHQKPEDDANKVIDTAKVRAPPSEVASNARYAAISPQVPWDTDSLENLVDFISVLRSALYRQGSYYSLYKKHQLGGKRKEPESDDGMLRKVQKQTDKISPNSESEPKKRRRKETMPGMSKVKQDAETKAGHQSGGNISVATRLALIQSGSKSGNIGEKSKIETSSAKKKEKSRAEPSASSLPGNNEASKLNYIKQKLEDLTLMLEATGGKSSDVKTKLKSGMKGLLEDVNKMVQSSSS